MLYVSLTKNISGIFDTIFLVFFTIEFLLRLTLSPSKQQFLVCRMNLVDLFGISPFYLSLIVAELEDMQIIGKVKDKNILPSIMLSPGGAS